MSEETEPETQPRISITPLLEALEYDADYHLHRGRPAEQPESAPTEQVSSEGSEQAQIPTRPPRVLPWRNYMQAQGRRFRKAGAGMGFLVVGAGVLLAGVICIGDDIDTFMDSQPKEVATGFQVPTTTSSSQPIHGLPQPETEANNEKTTIPGKPLPTNWLSWCLFHLIFFTLPIIGCIVGANVWIRKAEEAEVGIPLTAANTGHLPAVDTLVRAAEKPAQLSQSTLLRSISSHSPPEEMLRPAAYTEEQQPKQLVRPSGRQE